MQELEVQKSVSVGLISKDRMPLQTMFSTMPGSETRIRQVKSWNDYVSEKFEAWICYGWWKKCMNLVKL